MTAKEDNHSPLLVYSLSDYVITSTFFGNFKEANFPTITLFKVIDILNLIDR